MYHLWLTNAAGVKTEIASAVGSPFWTVIFHTAQAMYGADNVSITFTPTPEHQKILDDAKWTMLEGAGWTFRPDDDCDLETEAGVLWG